MSDSGIPKEEGLPWTGGDVEKVPSPYSNPGSGSGSQLDPGGNRQAPIGNTK